MHCVSLHTIFECCPERKNNVDWILHFKVNFPEWLIDSQTGRHTSMRPQTAAIEYHTHSQRTCSALVSFRSIFNSNPIRPYYLLSSLQLGSHRPDGLQNTSSFSIYFLMLSEYSSSSSSFHTFSAKLLNGNKFSEMVEYLMSASASQRGRIECSCSEGITMKWGHTQKMVCMLNKFKANIRILMTLRDPHISAKTELSHTDRQEHNSVSSDGKIEIYITNRLSIKN